MQPFNIDNRNTAICIQALSFTPINGERSGEALRLAVSMRSANPVTFTSKGKGNQAGLAQSRHHTALYKLGLSLAALSKENGLSDSTLANALSRGWPKGEIIIAKAIGREPPEIWPTRYYDQNGEPVIRQLRKRI